MKLSEKLAAVEPTMTENEKPPREWWIIKERGYSTWLSDKPLNSADTAEEIHVIEYDAYAALRDRSKKLRDSILKISVNVENDFAPVNSRRISELCLAALTQDDEQGE